MWDAIVQIVLSIIGSLFGSKSSDPAQTGEKLGQAETEAANAQAALKEVAEADAARSAARDDAASGGLRSDDGFRRD